MPFAQAFAATITAALTGSLYYMAASPKGISPLFKTISMFHNLLINCVLFLLDPTYIMAPVLKTRSARDELKKLFAGSYKAIYIML